MMTIHKSKGLEFPIVFVMGLGTPLHQRQSTDTYTVHPRIGLGLRYTNPTVRTKRPTLLMNATFLRKRAEEKAERARVLYVALTRARDRLFMVGTGDASPFAFPLPKKSHGSEYSVWEAKNMLEWICQAIAPDDCIMEVNQSHVITPVKAAGSKEAWKVFFHKQTAGSSSPHEPYTAETNMDPQLVQTRIQRLLETVNQNHPPLADQPVPSMPRQEQDSVEDPLFPSLTWTHTPLKMGVTSLVQRLSSQKISLFYNEEGESAETKRLPLFLVRPKLLADLPKLPAYMCKNGKTDALHRGLVTHKALSLLPFGPLRELLAQSRAFCTDELRNRIEEELNEIHQKGIFTLEEKNGADVDMMVRFFLSDLGTRVLLADVVHREWEFTLYAPTFCDSLLQGVIDLCFLENNEWVLVDYKTDHVHSALELWNLYKEQIQIYQYALNQCTPYSVREAALFSLSIGESYTKTCRS